MSPILFTLQLPWGAQPVYCYGALLGLSLLVGLPIVRARCSEQPTLDPEFVGATYLAAVMSGLGGAKLLYRLENRALAGSHAPFFDFTEGGMSAYGGFLGGLLGASIVLAWKRQPLLPFADAAAPALAVGTLLTRVGCYLYGCDFGRPLSDGAPGWLARLGSFPRWRFERLELYGSPAFLHHVDRYGLASDANASLPVHPTQLYEACAALLLLALALALFRHRRFAGQVILAVATCYAVARFSIDYLRDDPERTLRFGFSTAQLISLAIAPTCAVLYAAFGAAARRRTLG